MKQVDMIDNLLMVSPCIVNSLHILLCKDRYMWQCSMIVTQPDIFPSIIFGKLRLIAIKRQRTDRISRVRSKLCTKPNNYVHKIGPLFQSQLYSSLWINVIAPCCCSGARVSTGSSMENGKYPRVSAHPPPLTSHTSTAPVQLQ